MSSQLFWLFIIALIVVAFIVFIILNNQWALDAGPGLVGQLDRP